jgi:hypothetical protein
MHSRTDRTALDEFAKFNTGGEKRPAGAAHDSFIVLRIFGIEHRGRAAVWAAEFLCHRGLWVGSPGVAGVHPINRKRKSLFPMDAANMAAMGGELYSRQHVCTGNSQIGESE